MRQAFIATLVAGLVAFGAIGWFCVDFGGYRSAAPSRQETGQPTSASVEVGHGSGKTNRAVRRRPLPLADAVPVAQPFSLDGLARQLRSGSPEAILSAGNRLIESNTEEALRLLLACLETIPDDEARQQIEFRLENGRHPEKAVLFLDVLATSSNAQTRFVVSRALASSMTPEVLQQLAARYLSADSTLAASGLADVLRLVKDPACLADMEAIVDATRGAENKEDLAAAAVDAIAQMGTPGAIAALTSRIDGVGASDIREFYLGALALCQNSDGREMLISLADGTRTTNVEVRAAATHALGNFSADDMCDTLLCLQGDAEEAIRKAAMQSWDKVYGIPVFNPYCPTSEQEAASNPGRNGSLAEGTGRWGTPVVP